MTRLHSRYLALDGTTDKCKITDDIQQFVTGRFIVEIKLNIIQNTIKKMTAKNGHSTPYRCPYGNCMNIFLQGQSMPSTLR